jgi:hypothetical protein
MSADEDEPLSPEQRAYYEGIRNMTKEEHEQFVAHFLMPMWPIETLSRDELRKRYPKPPV